MKKHLLILVPVFLMHHAALAQNCNAAFGYTIQNSLVYFNSIDSIQTGKSYWNFGDGTTGQFSYTSHNYSQPGTYTVRHIVTDSGYCSDTVTQIIQLQFTPSCSAAFNSFSDSVLADEYFFEDASVIVGSNFLNATWTVNDTSVGQGQSLTYVFPRLGTYSVCENLTTSSGCSSSICNSISITVADTCPIHAAFTASPSTANPYLFNFSDMGTGPIGSFLWSFGDGTTSSVENPTHIYEDTGTYTITLTETTASGLGILCSSTSTLTLIVPEGSTGPNDSDSCAVSISFSPISGKTGAFTLLVAGATNQDSVQWSIVKGYAANSATFIPKDSADIVTLTGINPIYSFPDTGFYTINATTITQSGCQASSGWQNLYIVSPNLIVSPPNTNSIMQIPVYPSPATDHLNIVISLTNYSSVTIDVYNAVGNFVISKKYGGMPGNNQLVLPVQKLPSGVYYIRINDGLNIHNSRFQKM